METDVRQLVTDMEELRTDIREQLRRTDNIAVVTEIGHRLLEANELLSSQLESTTKHFMNAIEVVITRLLDSCLYFFVDEHY